MREEGESSLLPDRDPPLLLFFDRFAPRLAPMVKRALIAAWRLRSTFAAFRSVAVIKCITQFTTCGELRVWCGRVSLGVC
jgi:hypothetical protein